MTRGDVQRVGFRYRVEAIARKTGVRGYVENVEDGTVRIVCEGDRETVNKFVNKIKIKDPPINVEEVEVKFSEPTGEFRTFNIKYGGLQEELAEGLGAGVTHLTQLRRGIEGLRSDIKGEFTALRSDVKDEFTTLRSDIKGGFTTLRSDMKGEFTMLRSDMKSEFTALRSDMKSEFATLRSEMKGGFTTLRSEIKELRSEIRESFSLMDKRYGDISKTLKRLAGDFHKLVKAYLSKKGS